MASDNEMEEKASCSDFTWFGISCKTEESMANDLAVLRRPLNLPGAKASHAPNNKSNVEACENFIATTREDHWPFGGNVTTIAAKL